MRDDVLSAMMAALFRFSGMLTVVAIGILSLVPGEARPHVVWPANFEHVAAYFVAATLLGLGFQSRSAECAPVLRIACLLTVYGGILELAQHFVPERMPDMLDWSANMLGAWLGAALVWLLRGFVLGALR